MVSGTLHTGHGIPTAALVMMNSSVMCSPTSPLHVQRSEGPGLCVQTGHVAPRFQGRADPHHRADMSDRV
jgi:hypothetical protein